jgi:hypothetical protein
MARKATSWRNLLKIHPAAELFPLMREVDPVAFGKMVEDIKQQGVLEPIALLDGQLLDGRNRLDALEEAGVNLINGVGELEYAKFPTKALPPDTDAVGYIISRNIHRRHLKPEDKEAAIEALIKLNPKKSDRQVAKETASNRNKVARVRNKLETSGDVSLSDTRTDSKGRKQQAHKSKAKAKTKTGHVSLSDTPEPKQEDTADASALVPSPSPQPDPEWQRELDQIETDYRRGLSEKEWALAQKATPKAARDLLINAIAERNELIKEVARLKQALDRKAADHAMTPTSQPVNADDISIPAFLRRGTEH